MVDTRFHAVSEPQRLGVMLASFPSPLTVDAATSEILLDGADELSNASRSNVALAASKSYADELRSTVAGVVIVAAELRDLVPTATVALVAERPQELFADLLDRLYPSDTRSALGGFSDADDDTRVIEEGVVLGPGVVLGRGVEIGRNTVVGANTVIGPGVAIGRNSIIGSNCTIDCAYLGNYVVVHAGARIGCEGFGWLSLGKVNRKVPQLGRVIVQDHVEIGANTTIDRGALGDTVLGEGTKVDNLVQIGHNCRIGRYCLIAAQSGLAGSTTLEDGVLMGGNSATAGHHVIGAGSVLRARSAVMGDLAPGSDVAGVPAQNSRDHWREVATLRRLSRREKR